MSTNVELTNPYKMEVKKEVFIEAMVKTFGNISAACKACNISRPTYYDWLKRDAEFKKSMQEGDYEERMKDFVELKLVEAASKGNIAAIIFMAKTKVKDRGYVERSEYTGAGGKPLIPEGDKREIKITLSNGTVIDLD